MIGLLLVGIVLLKPDWMSGKRLWLWLPLYGIGLLTAVLTLVDVSFGTQLWYTGPDPKTYVGEPFRWVNTPPGASHCPCGQ